MLIFVSCEEESAIMPSDNVPCYTILVSTDDTPSTRAHYEENGEKIVVSWDKGDRIKLKNANGEYDFIFRKMASFSIMARFQILLHGRALSLMEIH